MAYHMFLQCSSCRPPISEGMFQVDCGERARLVQSVQYLLSGISFARGIVEHVLFMWADTVKMALIFFFFCILGTLGVFNNHEQPFCTDCGAARP